MAAEHPPSPPPSQPPNIDVPISVDPPRSESAAGASAASQLAGEEPWEQSIRQAVRIAAQSQGFCRGQIGILVTDDVTIQKINQRHLGHDYPTDVISFDYHRGQDVVEGELVVSLCTARRVAREIGWDWQNELLLYVVHGTLHICGLEDATADQRKQMRLAEQAALSLLGIRDADAVSHGFAAEPRCQKGAVQP